MPITIQATTKTRAATAIFNIQKNQENQLLQSLYKQIILTTAPGYTHFKDHPNK